MSNAASGAILEAVDVNKTFQITRSLLSKALPKWAGAGTDDHVYALRGVDISIRRGEIVGIVGESGCGKSTLGRILAGISSPTSGEVSYRAKGDVTVNTPVKGASLDRQMVFQDPFASLNSRMRVQEIISEAALYHGLVSRAELDAFVDTQLDTVQLPRAFKTRFPHELSGGQRQRVGIARALSVNPEILVCDEAVSALDVSIQAQIVNLFMDLRSELDIAIFFISHDLSVVHHLSDRIVVMYLGKIVEEGPADRIFNNPVHPYTQGLLSECPKIGAGKRAFGRIEGELPSPRNVPKGCPFHTRCAVRIDRCRIDPPVLGPAGSGHKSACHVNAAASAV